MATKNYVNDGTASVTAGAKTVTFADVSLALMKSGDQFMQKGASGIIDTLNLDAGTAELVDDWGGTTTSAQPYTVMTIPVGAELANSTRTIMQYLNGPILSIAMMSGDDAPAAGDTLVWDSITGTWLNSTPAASLLSILTTEGDILQRKSGAVVRRTTSQLLTDLLNGNSTGTGNVVRAASPTITGTLTAATVTASGVVSGSNISVTNAVALGSITGAKRIDSGGSAGREFRFLDAGNSATGIDISSIGRAGILSATIGTDGSFLLGTTSAGGWSSAAVFEAKSGNGKYGISGYSNGTTGGPFAFAGRVDNTAAGFFQFLFSTGAVGTITTNGTSTAYNTSSDRRLKGNIQDASDCGAIIDALKVRSWDWLSNGVHEPYGLVAQEEYLVFPAAVAPGDAGDEITQQWGRDDSKLVPLLLLEVQSLRRRIAALEAN